jgi:hypothetical protein
MPHGIHQQLLTQPREGVNMARSSRHFLSTVIVALAIILSLGLAASPAVAGGIVHGTWYGSYGYASFGNTCDGVGGIDVPHGALNVWVYGYRGGGTTWVSYMIFRNSTGYTIGFNNGITMRGTQGDVYWKPGPEPIRSGSTARIDVYRTFSGSRFTMDIFPYVTQFYYGGCGLTQIQM